MNPPLYGGKIEHSRSQSSCSAEKERDDDDGDEKALTRPSVKKLGSASEREKLTENATPRRNSRAAGCTQNDAGTSANIFLRARTCVYPMSPAANWTRNFIFRCGGGVGGGHTSAPPKEAGD